MAYTRAILDWETFYDPAQKYSLRVMDPAAYILDPRFEEIGCAVKINKEPTIWVDGPDVGRYLKGLGDPSRIMFIAHNVLFDACIASWHHGFVAGVYVDTLAMARALLGHMLPRLDLGAVAAYLGVGIKGTTVTKVAGMTRQMIIDAGLYAEYAAYSVQDSDLCSGICDKLLPAMPVEEAAICDMVQRMAIEPVLRLDQNLLFQHLSEVMAEKQAQLASAGFTWNTPAEKAEAISRLMSNDMFAELLKSLGVDPPTKISPTTGELAWAFAKTDDGLKELAEHPDPAVQAVVAARLGHKSTMEETRTNRFIRIGQLTNPVYGTAVMPVALKVSGAHTHRLSGDWRLNQQNFRRPSRRHPRAMLRESIIAPEGKTLVVGDKAQIEARMNAVFCGQLDLIEQFARGDDPYSIFATKVFGFPVSKSTPNERFCGKTCLGVNTRVLTRRGWRPIVEVELSDQLWDGVEWVSHGGLVFQGMKQVELHRALSATPDHEILTELGWLEWRQVHTSPSLFRSALELASLPSCATNLSEPNSGALQGGTRSVAAAAGGRGLSLGATFEPADLRDATGAQKSALIQNGIGSIAKRCPTTTIAEGYSRASAPLSHDATLRPIVNTTRTAVEVFTSTRHGEKINSNFLGISKLSRGGIYPSSKWIAETITKGTNPATFDLLHEGKTSTTDALSTNWKNVSSSSKQRTPVYDLANAGPRQRFTVLTDGGPLIVHNCVLSAGYGVGWEKYQASIKHISFEQTGTPLVLTDEEAQKHIYLYRSVNHNIKAMWSYLQNTVIPMMTRTDCDFMLGPCRVMHEKIIGPGGLCLRYRGLHRDPASNEWIFYYGQRVKRIYGGKLLENIIQFLARTNIMQDALRLIKPMRVIGFKLAMQVHDELVYCGPVENAHLAQQLLQTEMRRTPAWMPGLPLGCDVAKPSMSYGLAK